MSIVDNHLYAQNEESDKESSMKSDTENDTESDMESDVESGAESSMENSAEEEIENKICADGAGRKHKDSHSNACKKKSSSHFSSKRMEISRHSLQLAMGAVELLGEIKDFVPYVGPAFKIVYSILGIVKVYQGAEVAKTTTDTLIDIQGKLTTVIEDLKKIPGRTVLQGRVDEYYSQIKVSAKLCSEVTPELRKRVLNDLFVKLWYLDDRIVQEGLETSFWLKSLFTSQDSPDESSSTNFDPNWGFEAIHTKFLKVFVQQQKAISVLKFYDIEPKAVQSFDLRLKKQLHLFWKMCEAEWNKEVGVLQQAQHEMNYHKNHAIVFATETKTSTFLTTLSGPDKAISLQKVDLRSNFNEINDGLRFEHHEMSMKFENWSFGLISEDKQLLPENLSSINKCRQIVCHKQFFCILHHKPTQITIADLKNSTNKTHLLRKGMNIQLFAIANDHIYILHLEGDDSNIYQIGSINKFFSPGALHLWIIIKKCKVRAMAGHGTCLYILHGTTIEVYDTVQGQVKAEWPNEGSRDPLQKILKESKDKSVFLLNVGSSLCLRVIEKNKTQFYFIKPFWPNMLPQLDISESGEFLLPGPVCQPALGGAETQTAQQAIQNTKTSKDEATHGKTTPLPDLSAETTPSVEKDIVTDAPAQGAEGSRAPPKQPRLEQMLSGRARGLYDCLDAEESKGELPFRKNDTLYNVKRTWSPDWLEVSNEAGKTGLVPRDYVVILQ